MIVGWPNYVDWYRENEGSWGEALGFPGPCRVSWPSGWGGEVTDSIAQGTYANFLDMDAVQRAFAQSIGTNVSWYNSGLKLVEVDDPVWVPICGDCGVFPNDMSVAKLMVPDFCAYGCAGCFDADWENCEWSQDCGSKLFFKTDPEVLSTYSRHLGGSNVGFLDGHARWMSQGELRVEGDKFRCGCWGGGLVESSGRLSRIFPGGPTTVATAGANASYPNVGDEPSTDCGIPPAL
jgi:prepilin-type processing-associated H-X9-DG protein